MSLSPLVFAEDRHDTLWGFERWLVSAHPAAPSVVADGPFAGRRFDELVATFGAALAGTRAQGRFPLLFKDISARLRLSVQVHPSEATAPLTGGEPKTEAWRILAAEPDAAIWLGVRSGISRDDLASAVAQNRVADALVRQRVQVGEMYYIPAGLVHCLGDGVRVFEVQQSSDTTYRLYDWDNLVMAEAKAGAKAPATVTVGGLEITPNADYVKSWEALELQMQLADPDLGNVEKVRIYMRLVEGMANTASPTLASDIIPQKRFGEGMSWFTQGNAIASVLAPGVSLAIYYSFGAQVSVAVSACFFALAFACSRLVKTPNEPADQKVASAMRGETGDDPKPQTRINLRTFF